MIATLALALLFATLDAPVNQLPEAAQKVLNSRLTVNWTLAEGDLYKCDLNGDTLPDYAVKVTVGNDSCLVEYYVALIAYNQTYAFHLLAASPAWSGLAGRTTVRIRRKGAVVMNNDTDEPKQLRLLTDAIELVPVDGCCSTIHIFRNGTFDMITSGD